ncbi:hypothetical protein BCR44DRAFT_41323 [Catenaria anguillulae PL171]|uniref:RFX-type winged-helix domain-containing protein n=1 Tax=Catenaria anguillulae PL171 TaxID=765915 RepID=A0A1Y2HU81_9FUNG|nr:hypothetical protein BCR44DRAFT_41323 [Catenaria anguillulae PL171]
MTRFAGAPHTNGSLPPVTPTSSRPHTAPAAFAPGAAMAMGAPMLASAFEPPPPELVYFHGGYHNRLLLALQSTLPNEIDWALSILLKASAIEDREIHLIAVPGLVDTLISMLDPIFTVGASDDLYLHSLESTAVDLERALFTLQILRNFSFTLANARQLAYSTAIPTVSVRILKLPEDMPRIMEARHLALDLFENMLPAVPIPNWHIPESFAALDAGDKDAQESAAGASQSKLDSTDLLPLLFSFAFSRDRAFVMMALNSLASLAMNDVHHRGLLHYYSPAFAQHIGALLTLHDRDLALTDRALELVYQWTLYSDSLARALLVDLPRSVPSTLLRIVKENSPSSRAFEVAPTAPPAHASVTHRARLTALFESRLVSFATRAAQQLGIEGADAIVNSSPTMIVIPQPPPNRIEPLRALGWAATLLDADPTATKSVDQVYASYTEYASVLASLLPDPASSSSPATTPPLPGMTPPPPAAAPTSPPLNVHTMYPKDKLMTTLTHLVPGARVVNGIVYGIALRPSLYAVASAPRGPGSRRRTSPSLATCLWDGCTYRGADVATHVEAQHLGQWENGTAVATTCPWAGCTSSKPHGTDAKTWRAHLMTHVPVSHAVPPLEWETAGPVPPYPHSDILAHIKMETKLDPAGAPLVAALVLRNLVRAARKAAKEGRVSSGVGEAIGADGAGARRALGSMAPPEDVAAMDVDIPARQQQHVMDGVLPLESIYDDLVIATAMQPRVGRFLGEVMEELWGLCRDDE